MKIIRFKTTIKCSGCVDKVSQALNRIAGENNWEVDLQDPDKTLKVTAAVSEQEVMEALKESGYLANKLD